MSTLLVTGKSLASQWVSKFEGLGYKVINGSAEALARLGISAGDTDREMTEAELSACLRRDAVEVYVYGGLEPASRGALEGAQGLKFISFLGTGWSDPGCVDAEAATEFGIRVSNTPHANALSVAEFAFGAIIGASRHMYSMAPATASGQWSPIRGSDIAGKTLGIVGLGAIGSRLARIARLGADMNVCYYGPNRKTDLEDLLSVRRFESLTDLFAQSDVVSIHAPATSDTEALISRSEFAAAAAPLLLINCAAPEIVDGEALRNALENGVVNCAVFDGRYPDANLDSALLAMGPDRFVQFPRSAWLTDESYERMASMSYSSVKSYAARDKAIPFLVLDD